MHPIAALFDSIGEPYAAGLFEEPEKGYFYRHALALARYYEHLPPARYEGEHLYPYKRKFVDALPCAVKPQFALTYTIDWHWLEQKSPEAAAHLREFEKVSHNPGGWTHGAPNYKRVLREGLASYRDRIIILREKTPDKAEFYDGLLALVNAMEDYLRRSVAYLRSVGAGKLANAVEKVPFAPAESCYEAIVAWNLIFYFDGADNLGCLDDGLAPYFDGGDYTDMIRELFDNIDAAETWSCTIGPVYNDITRQALRAIGKHRRPMLELMTTPEMPDDIWQMAIENLQSGSTHPSFYNANAIGAMLSRRFPSIPTCELDLFCGCGCTETNLQGLTRAGGTDDNIPLALIFNDVLHRELANCATFEDFYEAVCTETERKIDEQLDAIVERYIYMSKYLPNPMRTLLFDDCIDKGLDFNAGGARYTWTQSSDSGMVNTCDCLIAVRELVYRRKQYTADEFIEKLDAEDPIFKKILLACPCYGTDNEDADALAASYAERVYKVYHNKKPKAFIDAYLLTEHQFSRYLAEGEMVGATPDGRGRGEALCDSISAVRGKAVDGPTAMLKSAARLPQHLADGISVLNLTLAKGFLAKSLRALVEAYFAMGGIQVQVTCTSVEELQDAMVHPDKHRDLIVRVGGYSEYFVNLHPGLRAAVLERNIHELT